MPNEAEFSQRMSYRSCCFHQHQQQLDAVKAALCTEYRGPYQVQLQYKAVTQSTFVPFDSPSQHQFNIAFTDRLQVSLTYHQFDGGSRGLNLGWTPGRRRLCISVANFRQKFEAEFCARFEVGEV